MAVPCMPSFISEDILCILNTYTLYIIHYTLYIIHDTLCILNDDVRYIPYKHTTKNLMRYYVVCILYFVFQKMMFLYKVYEQNNKELVVFRVVKNKREKTKMA